MKEAKLPMSKAKRERRSKFTSFLFVLPYLLLFLAFLFIPLVYGIYISVHDYNLLSSV